MSFGQAEALSACGSALHFLPFLNTKNPGNPTSSSIPTATATSITAAAPDESLPPEFDTDDTVGFAPDVEDTGLEAAVDDMVDILELHGARAVALLPKAGAT